jgi:hypothetical protein
MQCSAITKVQAAAAGAAVVLQLIGPCRSTLVQCCSVQLLRYDSVSGAVRQHCC